MEEQVVLTKEGHAELQRELEELKTERQPAVIKRIQQAKEFGDLSENAEYDDAKNEQGFVAGRIAEIEEILKRAKVVHPAKTNGGIVQLGSRVKVHIDGEEADLTIVGAAEADPIKEKISHESPLGKALLGKKTGDKVEVTAPSGTLLYTIRSVK